jgi:hypothetical protein
MFAMGILDKLTDFTPALRCSAEEVIGVVTGKAFVKDTGFGDCPMGIDYEFADLHDHLVCGRFEATESSFYQLKIGDKIIIRYLKDKSHINAPRDSIAIIRPFIGGDTSASVRSEDEEEQAAPSNR